MLCDLYTPAGENFRGTPWTVYPRPQMKRDNWINLNGNWEYVIDAIGWLCVALVIFGSDR